MIRHEFFNSSSIVSIAIDSDFIDLLVYTICNIPSISSRIPSLNIYLFGILGIIERSLVEKLYITRSFNFYNSNPFKIFYVRPEVRYLIY